MKILLAGGAGYIGALLTPRLLDRGYSVTVVDQLWFGNHLPDDTVVRQMDVMDLTAQDLDGFDQVVFLAGLSNDPMADYSPKRNFIANAAAPAYLAYIAKRAGVRRYVYASTCSVYGYTVDELFDEDGPTVSNYPYGISKLQGETAVRHLSDESFSVIALRKGTVCGYSPRMRLDLVVNTMFRTAVSEGTIHVNNPSIWRPILPIQDAVAAYVRAIECSPSISGVFNIASGNYTIGEIADGVHDALQSHLGISPKIEIHDQHDLRNYKVATQRAEEVLSFKPAHSIADIIADLVKHRDRFDDFDNPLYSNIATFQTMDSLSAEASAA